MLSTSSDSSAQLINLTLCNEANEIHVHFGMILTQIFVIIINLSSTIVTGVFAQFVFSDKTKHVHYRALLISVTVAVSLRAAFTLARAMRILAFIAINEIKPCSLVTEKVYCKFETEMKFLPLTAGAISLTFLIFERTFASIFYIKYESRKNKKLAIFMAFLPWLITVACMFPSFFLTAYENGYVAYCGTLSAGRNNEFILQHWELPATMACIFICLLILLFTLRKRKSVIIDVSEERFNARIQFDKNLIFAQKVVLITLFGILSFVINYGIINITQMFEFSVNALFLFKESTNVTFGIYGFLFVYINIYKLESYKKHYSNLFKRFCISSPLSKLGLCYSTRNSAALTIEGKEYFQYYRQQWQCEKRRTFLGWTLY